MNNVLFAFLLSAVAGLSTGIGSAIAFFAKRENKRFLSVALGFSAGVMVYISFMGLFPRAIKILESIYGLKIGMLIAALCLFGGMLLIILIEQVVPSVESPQNILENDNEDKDTNFVKKEKKLIHTALFTAIAITLHNFPEGVASFMSALQAPEIALPIVFAIAIHNIPEGAAVSIPIYYATGSKKKAFWISFASGLTEPLGAIVAYLLLRPFWNNALPGITFAFVAGIMIYISFSELLPTSRQYGEDKLSLSGLLVGMFVMSISLVLLV